MARTAAHSGPAVRAAPVRLFGVLAFPQVSCHAALMEVHAEQPCLPGFGRRCVTQHAPRTPRALWSRCLHCDVLLYVGRRRVRTRRRVAA